MYKIGLLIASLLLTTHSFAGDKVGNGGGLWTCSYNNTVQEGFLVDLYEATEEFGLTLISFIENDPMVIAKERANFVKSHLPEYAAKLIPLWFKAQVQMRMVDSELVVVDDALFRIKPPKSSCRTGWNYTQFANFTNQDQILIREDLWYTENVRPIDKAALLWHEIIYKWLRDEYKDKDSVRARQIVGLLFSTNSSKDINYQIKKILNTFPNDPIPSEPIQPIPVEPLWMCQTYNAHTSKYFADYGSSQLEASTKTTQKCQSAENGFFCEQRIDKCEEISAIQNKFACQNKNPHTSKVYLGKGRSLLEAEFKARESCQNEANFFFCEKNVTCE